MSDRTLKLSKLPLAHEFLRFEIEKRLTIAQELACHLGKDFELIPNDGGDFGLPRFRQIDSDIVFRFILPGTYSMGLSKDEEVALIQLSQSPRVDVESMRPVHDVSVAPFLISERPVLLKEYRRFKADYANPKSYPAYLRRDEASRAASMTGCRLPTEVEWEYVCRATTTSLFVWGNHLPEYDELTSWIDIEFDGTRHHARNPFGIQGLFTGTWCLDHYRESYLAANHAEEEHSCRGGGSYFWPWQDDEWIWCISAHRFSSSMLDVDQACGLFLAHDLI